MTSPSLSEKIRYLGHVHGRWQTNDFRFYQERLKNFAIIETVNATYTLVKKTATISKDPCSIFFIRAVYIFQPCCRSAKIRRCQYKIFLSKIQYKLMYFWTVFNNFLNNRKPLMLSYQSFMTLLYFSSMQGWVNFPERIHANTDNASSCLRWGLKPK